MDVMVDGRGILVVVGEVGFLQHRSDPSSRDELPGLAIDVGAEKVAHLSVPEVGSQIVCPVAELKGEDFMHGARELSSGLYIAVARASNRARLI